MSTMVLGLGRGLKVKVDRYVWTALGRGSKIKVNRYVWALL